MILFNPKWINFVKTFNSMHRLNITPSYTSTSTIWNQHSAPVLLLVGAGLSWCYRLTTHYSRSIFLPVLNLYLYFSSLWWLNNLSWPQQTFYTLCQTSWYQTLATCKEMTLDFPPPQLLNWNPENMRLRLRQSEVNVSSHFPEWARRKMCSLTPLDV